MHEVHSVEKDTIGFKDTQLVLQWAFGYHQDASLNSLARVAFQNQDFGRKDVGGLNGEKRFGRSLTFDTIQELAFA